MRLPSKKILLALAAALVLSFAAYEIFKIKISAEKSLADAERRADEKSRVPFEKIALPPHRSQAVQILQNTNAAADFAEFRGSYFAATSGGLAQFSSDGKLVKHFTVLDGLPESDLTALAVFGDALFIGARGENLIVFDGEKFTGYRFTDRAAGSVTALLDAGGRLLIGTSKGGLVEFDGANFAEIRAAGDKRILGVNCLYKSGARLAVGTFDDGLWIDDADVWTHLTTADNLASNRVVGVVERDKNLYVATDLGLSILEGKTARPLAVLPALNGLAERGNQIFLVKTNGEISTFENSLKEFSAREDLQNARIISAAEKLWLLSGEGIAEIDAAKIKPFAETENDSLTDNFVSALAFDARRNLWVGTFRRGIDVFAESGKKLKHIESERAREINFLQAGGDGTVSAATTGGLISFKNDFSAAVLTKNDGLPSDSVAHFSGAFLATARGLAFRENGRIRVLSTVQNLPSDSVYATLADGGKLYAGTLGGLAEIENNRVARAYKSSNSNLRTDWVTALARCGERTFVGTYGGGIFELSPSGEIRSFETDAGKFVVNPNAMFCGGERLYAGTLAGARVLDLRTQSWRTVRKILPSATVLSVAGDGAGNVYLGTSNGIARVSENYFAAGAEAE